MRSGQRWPECGMPKCEVIYCQALSLEKAAIGGMGYSTHQPFNNDKSPPHHVIIGKGVYVNP